MADFMQTHLIFSQSTKRHSFLDNQKMTYMFLYQRLRCLTHMGIPRIGAELIQVGAGGFAPCLQR